MIASMSNAVFVAAVMATILALALLLTLVAALVSEVCWPSSVSTRRLLEILCARVMALQSGSMRLAQSVFARID